MSDKSLDAVRQEIRSILHSNASVANDDVIGELLSKKPKVVKEATKSLLRMALIKLTNDVAVGRKKVSAEQFELFEGVTHPEFVMVPVYDETGKLLRKDRMNLMALQTEEADRLFAGDDRPKRREKARDAGAREIYTKCRPYMKPGMSIADAMRLADADAVKA